MKLAPLFFALLFNCSFSILKAQPSQKLLGKWEGLIEMKRNKSNTHLRCRISIDNVSSDSLSGTIYYLTDKEKIAGEYPFKGTYREENGKLYISYEAFMTYLKSLKTCKGNMRLEYTSENGKSILSGSFYPLNDIDVGKHTIAVMTLNYQGGTIPNAANKGSNNELTALSSNKVIKTDEKSSGSKELVGAALLFKNVKSKLSSADKNSIYGKTGFSLAKDPSQFVLKGMEDYPFTAEAHALDLNKDGIEEVFIEYGNNHTSGMAGGSVMGFSGDAYYYRLGFDKPGILSTVISVPSGTGIVLGGPGFSFPVHFVGSNFTIYEIMTDEQLKQCKTVELKELEGLYQQGGSKAVTERLQKLRLETDQLKYKRQDDAEAALQKRIAAQKESVSKFLGKWWEMGNYANPYTLVKIGNFYVLTSKNKKSYNGLKLTFNSKLDRLEGWLETPNMKLKMIVNYIYESDKLEIRAAENGRGMPGYLIKYK